MRAAQSRIVLTGAGGGIGRATASTLACAGASLLLVGRSPERLADQARELVAAGAPTAHIGWHACDLTCAASIDRLAAEAATWGCNVVLHGAGLPAFGRLQSQSAADMQAVLQTNLLAPMLLTRALLGHLLQQPAAQVICVGSALGRIGLPGFSVYSASKFGLHGFAEALRRELAETSVRVQYIGPRSTETGFNNADVAAYNQATGTAMDPPAEVAREILRLLEDGSAERFLGFPEKLAVRLNGVLPTWLDGSFHKHRHSLPPAPALTAGALPS